MVSNVAVARHIDQQARTQGSVQVYGLPNPTNTGRAFDALTPDERESFLDVIELDFRNWIGRNRSSSGFVFYPNTRQIMRALTTLYQTLADIDFSNII